jgi:hypothetical protein
MTDIIRVSPSGPELIYPAVESGKVLTVNAAGEVRPQPNGAGSGGFPASTTSHIIFVSPVAPGGWGSDTTGDGSETKPYATIAHAQSVVATPSITNVWEIVLLPGEFAENVALLAFTRIMGFDASASQAAVQAARISGNITLGTGWAAALAFAAVSNVYVDGDVTLDYPTATSADGSVSFTNCNIAGVSLITQDASNATEFHACTFEGNCTVLGGRVDLVGSSGTSDVSQLRVAARAATQTLVEASGGGWAGDLYADQNGIDDQDVIINMRGFGIGQGTRVTAFVAKCPQVNGAYGATLENPTLDGSAAVALSPQMRVEHAFVVPSGTLIEGLSLENALLLLPATLLGATSIETMACTLTPTGDAWGIELAQQRVSWSFYVRQNGGASEVHVVMFNPNTDDVTTTADLPLLFNAFLREPIVPVP